MHQGKLIKLQRSLESLRKRSGNIKPKELMAIATALGRRRVSRGKEPTFESEREGFFPLSIPDHPGTLKKGTACRILDFLENEIEILQGLVGEELEDDGLNEGEEEE